MKDSTFTITSFPIALSSKHKQFTITVLGDIHWGSPACDTELFLNFLHTEKSQLNSYYLFVGDEIDAISTSERAILYNKDIHESTAALLDKFIAEQLLSYARRIEFMRGKIIGRIQGNHFWVFSTSNKQLGYSEGMTSTDWLCRYFNCPPLGYLAYIRIPITFNHNNKTVLDTVACHGKAGGKLVGTSINQVEQLRDIFPEAHLYCMGHNHDRGAWPVTNLRVVSTTQRELKLKERLQYLCRTGSFLKSFSPSEPSYAAKRLYRPKSLGAIKFIVAPTKSESKSKSTVHLNIQALS